MQVRSILIDILLVQIVITTLVLLNTIKMFTETKTNNNLIILFSQIVIVCETNGYEMLNSHNGI